MDYSIIEKDISLITCKAIENKRFLKSVSTHLGEFIRFSMSECCIIVDLMGLKPNP